MEETLYTRNNLIIAFFIGLIIGFGGYYLWDNRPGTSPEQDTTQQEKQNGGQAMEEDDKNNGEQENGGVQMSDNSVQVPDQPAGLRVILPSLSVGQDSWVAIHEDMDGSVSPVILGASRFDAGEYTDEVANLLRNTEEGNTYYAVIHVDDGDKEFDPEKDTPVTNSQGAPVMDAFRAVPIR